MTVRSIAVKLQAQVGEYIAGMRQAKAATGDLITELSKSEQQRQNMQKLGTGLLVAGAGIAAGLGLATKAAIDWETAWAGVVKTVDGSEAQLAALEDELREMARTLPQSHAEIAAVAEAAGQLGVATDDIASFTRTMVDLGVATNMTSEQAAFAIARMTNIMSTSADDVDKLGATIVDLGNNSATTEAEILEMALRISGAGATIGLAETDVLGFAAALSSVGVRAQAGGSAISRAMIEIEGSVREGGEALDTIAEVAGQSAEQFTQAYQQDAAAAIATFIGGLGRMQESGEDVFAVLDELGFSEIRLRDALLRLASSGDLLTNSLDRGAKAWDENLALTEEAERRYDTTAAKLEIARNQINDMAITMGETFLPVVGEAAEKVGGLAEFLGDMPEPVIRIIGVLGAATAAIALTGGTALIAIPKIAAYRQAMDQLQASGGVTAATAGRVRSAIRGITMAAGPATAALLGAEAAASALESALFDDLNPNVEAVATGLERLAKSGELSGEVARILGEDISNTSREFDRLISDAWWDKAAVGVQGFVEKIPGFASTFSRLAFDLELPRQQIEAIDQALALMARESPQLAEEAFARLTSEMGLSAQQTERLRDKLTEWASAAEIGEAQAEETADGMNGMASAAEQAAEKVEELREAFDALFNMQMDLHRATLDYRQGMADLVEVLDDAEATLKLGSQAGRDNRRAVLDQIDAINDLREANIENGMSIDDANEKYVQQLDKLEDLLIDRGFEEEAVRDIIAAYSDIPSVVSTTLKAPGMSGALSATQELQNRLNALDRSRATVHVDVIRAGGEVVFQRHGGIVAAQRGLITSSPTVLFGERGTGQEAFIPRDGIPAQRGLALADAAARWHGGKVVAGDGAELGGPWQWHGGIIPGSGGGGGAGQAQAMAAALANLPGGDSGPTVHVHVAGSIRSDRELTEVIRDELLRGGFRGALGGA